MKCKYCNLNDYGHKSNTCVTHRNIKEETKEEIKPVKKKTTVKKKQVKTTKNKAISKTNDK